ncbi:MAG: VOC family protein [Myxococcales bacterium]|nr:VOC family protein [Myxococcales bacterium]
MPIQLDHLILKVNDLPESVAFYQDVLGLAAEGPTGPFEVLRVTPELTLQLAPWGTEGGEHLAFAFEPAEFDAAFSRLQAAGVAYGDSFHSAENMQGPGEEDGARGPGRAIYFFDPNRHLIEIRSYQGG